MYDAGMANANTNFLYSVQLNWAACSNAISLSLARLFCIFRGLRPSVSLVVATPRVYGGSAGCNQQEQRVLLFGAYSISWSHCIKRFLLISL